MTDTRYHEDVAPLRRARWEVASHLATMPRGTPRVYDLTFSGVGLFSDELRMQALLVSLEHLKSDVRC